MNENKFNASRKDVWNFNLDDKLFIEVVHWGVERGKFEAMNDGRGIWNYYILIPERVMPDKFNELWLEDEVKSWSNEPNSNKYVSHNYMEAPFSNVDWHGGITSYEKMGQIKGFRSVRLGCDFNHLWDEGKEYTFEDVAYEAMETAKQLKELYKL